MVVIVCGIYISSLNKNTSQDIQLEGSYNELWQTATTEQGVSFSYPKELLTKYISEVVWPPQVKVEGRPFFCENSGSEIEAAGQTVRRLVDDRTYCVTKKSEGAAGSVYTEYLYSFSKNDLTVNIDFALRFVQCQNYDESQVLECENERESFDVDGVIDRIAQSIDITNLMLDYKNISYNLDGHWVSLVNGLAEDIITEDSQSKIITRYFGNEASGDINNDGRDDVAFLLTQDGGGSGIFYYVVAALQTDFGYRGIGGILLGDRIAPQNTEINNGTVIVNYADRVESEAMATLPSIGVSKYFIVENNILVPVDIK